MVQAGAVGARDVALVTGAAGDIGRALCAKLTRTGFSVVAWDVAPAPAGVEVTTWQTVDLSADELPGSLAGSLSTAGPLRGVFHVVGGSDPDELAQTDPALVPMDVFRRTVALNLCSAYAVLRATVGLMRASHGDRSYTFVSSINSLGGYGSPGYSAAKAGLHGMVRALAVPLGADGIRINAVALGSTRTANFARLADALGGRVDFERLGERTARGRILTPDEAAAAIAAVGVDNPALSGAVIVADAAQSIARR